MKEKITKNRKYILAVLGILILATLFVGVKYLMRPKYEPLPVVKLKDKETNKKKFAVMVQNGDSYEEYTNEDGTWPSEDDYEFKEAKCIDNDGQLVENAVTFANGKVTLKTNKTIYCTLYFDESIKTTIQLLRKNDPQNKLSSATVGGMYRFQGKNTDTINNYICFGTDNKEDCACTDEKTCDDTKLDKYMYRIIGITEEGQLYLIKMKGVETDSSKTFEWSIYWGSRGGWPTSDAYFGLNGEYSDNNSNIFVNNTRYGYMVEGNEWYTKIENHNWKYGIITDASNNGITIYNTENAWSDNTEAKIGLMYLHDYYLAYDSIRNWSSDYDTSNWIHFVNNKNTTGASEEILLSVHDSWEWRSIEPCIDAGGGSGQVATGLDPSYNFEVVDSMELRSNNNSNKIVTIDCHDMASYNAYKINSVGNPTYGSGGLDNKGIVRPTFYVSSTVTIKSGTGSITDPYILNVQE